MKTNRRNLTLKEFKELHSLRQSKTLTPYEKYKIMCTLKSPIEVLILVHLYTKFLHFDMKEFHQRKFDIQVGTSNYSENTITNNLNNLERKGYFTSEFKTVQGKQYKRLHFNVNLEKMNEFLSVGDELKPENFSRLIETLRRKNEIVKPNPYTKTHKLIDKPEDDMLDNNTDSKTTEPAVEPEILSNDDIPIEEIIEPKNEPNEVIDEPINSTKEDMNNNNDNTTKEIMKMNEVTDKAKFLLELKDEPKLKPIFNDLRLSDDQIIYLCSDKYVAGINKKLDSNRDTLNVLYNMRKNK